MKIQARTYQDFSKNWGRAYFIPNTIKRIKYAEQFNYDNSVCDRKNYKI